MNLSAELEKRAVAIARTTPFRLQSVRDALGDSVRVFGEEKTIDILSRHSIEVLAMAAMCAPALMKAPAVKGRLTLMQDK